MLVLDIYRYQTVDDWQAVKRHGVKAVWVKLTDGRGTAQVKGDKQTKGARDIAGIPVGGYHFAQPGNPEEQADVFTAELKRLRATDIPPALDIEAPFQPNAAARDFAIRFLNRMRHNGFDRLAIYMNNSFASSLRPESWGIPGLVKWIARYGAKPSVPWDVHQYSETGRVPGITGQVDLNESRIDLTEGNDDDMPNTQEIVDAVLNASIAKRGNGTDIKLGDALANLYLGAYYGGGDAGTPEGVGVFKAVAETRAAVDNTRDRDDAAAQTAADRDTASIARDQQTASDLADVKRMVADLGSDDGGTPGTPIG